MSNEIRIVCTVACLLCTVYSPVLAGDCSTTGVKRAETELAAMDERIGILERELAQMSVEMKALASQIDAEKAGGEGGINPFRRRRLENLLKESRTKATAMEPLTSEKSRLENDRARVVSVLRECYGESLRLSLADLLAAVRTRQYQQARSHMETVNAIEGKLKRLEAKERQGTYPRISDEFISDALASVEERSFLLDTMRDLREKAERDQGLIKRKQNEVRESIQLKQDLLDLIDEAEGGGDGAAFFDEFSAEGVALDLVHLKKEAEHYKSALKTIKQAIDYYRERIVFLNKLLENDVE
jgi:hypothetical protein